VTHSKLGFAVVLAASVVLSCSPRPVEPAGGEWRAWLDSPGGELPFGLELRHDGDQLSATVINGSERIPVPRVERT